MIQSVLRTSAWLVDLGADKEQVTVEIFANKRFAATKLVANAVAAARLDENGRYCWTVVDEAMLKACNADDSSPAGTVVDGMKKVVSATPFGGTACRWEQTK